MWKRRAIWLYDTCWPTTRESISASLTIWPPPENRPPSLYPSTASFFFFPHVSPLIPSFQKKSFWKKNPLVFRLSLFPWFHSFIPSKQHFQVFLSLSLKSFASISHARLDPPSLPFSMACDRVEVVRSRHYIHHLTGPGNFLPCSVVRWQIISTTPDSFTLH